MENKNLSLYKFLNLYRDIPEADFEIITQHLYFREALAGETLLEIGEPARELFFIVQGVLKITAISDKGNPFIQFFIRENKFCTILSSFTSNSDSQEGIVAATNIELLVFPRHALKLLNEKVPYFKNLVESITHKTLLDKMKMRNSYLGEEVSTQYLRFVTQQPDIMHRVPLSDVASYLDIPQRTLSKIRRHRHFLLTDRYPS